MRWQKLARLAIAAFVVVFAAVVMFTLYRRTSVPPPAPAEAPPAVQNAAIYNPGGVNYEETEGGKLKFRLVAKSHVLFDDGRQRLEHIELTLPDRNGKTVVVRADEAILTNPPQKQLGTADLSGHVVFTTDDGLEVNAGKARYDDATGLLTVPDAVEFTRGRRGAQGSPPRMKGSGIGARYDKNRDELTLLEQAHIVVAPDSAGQGGAEATAGAATLARADNYINLNRDARIVSEGRTITADDVKIVLQADGNTIDHAELRGNSRIVESGESARNMSARNIDLLYAEDGRTLQGAKLIENAVVELPGTGGAPGRRIAGNTIDMAMGPDGSTLTLLNAAQNVQVDLPGQGDVPAKRIRAATLRAAGPPDVGLQSATFEGQVEYRETAAARRDAPAVDRTARSERLIIATKPGLGDLERADFRGRFSFTDGTTVSAGSPRALYHLNADRLELSPLEKEPGPTPLVNDGELHVEATRIQLSPSSRKLTAETNVRSTLQPRRREATNGRGGGDHAAEDARMPVMLDQDRPVYVAADRLAYDGVAEATYTGNARLWQDGSQSKIDAQTIIINDRTGNLTARTNVRTSMLMDDVDPQTKQTTLRPTVATSNELVYDDAKRVAVYTGTEQRQAHMIGAHGDVTADRIDLYLQDGGREVERAEARGKVTVKEEVRIANGAELVYTASDDKYVMKGKPVVAIEREATNSCKQITGTTLTFRRSVGSISADAAGTVPVDSKPVPCPVEWRN